MPAAAWLLAGAALLVAAADLAGLIGGDGVPPMANRDFANYWIAARLVLAGQALDLFSGQEIYFPHMQAAFGPDYPWHAWSYPPHYLLFIWPLGYLTYLPAMAAFLAATLALFLLAARAFAGRIGWLGVAILLPFVIFNAVAAQNGFLSGGLLLGALAWRFDRPVLAGLLAGCLTVKPQLGILIPLLFLIEGRWTAIASAAVTTAGLVIVSALAFGVESWTGYVTETFAYQSDMMYGATGIFLDMMPSVFGSLRNLGVEPSTAMLAHLMVALPALFAAGLAFLRCRDPGLRAVILVVATFIVTPYSLAYDLGALSAALLVGWRHASGPGIDSLVVTVAALPILIVPLGLMSLPLAPLLLLLLFLVLLARAGLASPAAGMVPSR